MSNLVENELVLTGTPASLASARSTLGDPEADEADQRLLNFALLVPMPAGMIDRPPTQDCGSGKHSEPMDWYCWRLEHCGTARDASYVSLEGSPESGLLRYDFSTTNTPVPHRSNTNRTGSVVILAPMPLLRSSTSKT